MSRNTPPLPEYLQPQPWHIEATAEAVENYNSKRAKLAEAIAESEAAVAEFAEKPAEKLAPKDLADAEKRRGKRLTLRSDAVALCDEALDVLDAISNDMRGRADELAKALEDEREKLYDLLVESGHYRREPFDMRNAGGLLGWQGQILNSQILARMANDARNAKHAPEAVREWRKGVKETRQKLVEQIDAMRRIAGLIG